MTDKNGDVSFSEIFVPLTVRKIILFIILIGCIVFSNTLFNAFVWDDRTFIQFNPEITRLDLGFLLGPNMFNNVNAGQYRPLVAIYFTFLHSIFGNTPFFYHVIQIGIHIASTIMVLYLLKKFLRLELAFFLSLIFLVHPIQVESVSFVAASGNPLFTLFGLGAVLLSMGKTTLKKQIGVCVLLLLSLMAKETGILFVGLVVLYQVLFQRKQVLGYILSGGSAFLLYCFLRFAVAGVFFSKVELAPITRLDFIGRVINMPAVIGYYLKTVSFPYALAINQSWIITEIDFLHFYLPLSIVIIFLGSIFYGGWYLWKSKNEYTSYFLFSSAWLLSGLFVYSQITALDMTVADRWFYFPLIGLLGLGGIVLEKWFGKFLSKRLAIWLMITIIVLLSIRTMVRNTDWQDPITLYSRDSLVENNFDLQNSLGGEYNMIGQREKALQHFKNSVALFPHETNLFNLGLSYEQKKDFKTAEKYYWQAYHSKSYGEVPKPYRHHTVTYQRLALVVLQHDPKTAQEIITNGIKEYPNDPMMWYVLSLAAHKVGNKQEALRAAQNLNILLPNSVSAKTLLQQLQENKAVDTTIH